jgi:hypothetical protein
MKALLNFLFGRKVTVKLVACRKLPDYLVRHMEAQDAGMFNPRRK